MFRAPIHSAALLILAGSLCGAGCKPAADVNKDGVVDQLDVDAVVACLGLTPQAHPECAPANVIADGLVDLADRNFVYSRKHDLECNGAAHLCDRRFDAVAYPMTHNAYSTQADGYIAPNQYLSMAQQLQDGIRAMELDIYSYQGQTVMCHGTGGACLVGGSRSLVDGLVDIRNFLDANLGEIVALHFEAFVSQEDAAAAFAQAGLLGYTHVPNIGEPWPTLRKMIERGERLVVLTTDPTGGYPWYRFNWDFTFTTPYEAFAIANFSCDFLSGAPWATLFQLPHFLTQFGPAPLAAPTVNANPFFLGRVLECEGARNHFPNFVSVDFYDVGDLFEVVAHLNGEWTIFESESDFSHGIGRADEDGWSASTTEDAEGHLSFGPYTTELSPGLHVAYYRLMIDDNDADDLAVVDIDVYDATAGQVLAHKPVTRRQFDATYEYQDFVLSFDVPAGHEIEFRTYWHDVAYIRQDHVAVR